MNESTDTASTPNQPPAHQWAPWWVYLIVLLGANYLRAYALPGDELAVPVVVVIALAQAAVLFVVVTAIWRLAHRDERR